MQQGQSVATTSPSIQGKSAEGILSIVWSLPPMARIPYGATAAWLWRRQASRSGAQADEAAIATEIEISGLGGGLQQTQLSARPSYDFRVGEVNRVIPFWQTQPAAITETLKQIL